MPIAKIKKVEREHEIEKLPVNYYEFFERKAKEARAFLEKHPVPDHILNKKA